jgi:arylsulfatase A-like enzyme
VACIEYLDRIIAELIKKAPANTWLMVTSDHGELFGEGGYFGHGPVVHEKVFEVFFVEGKTPRSAHIDAAQHGEGSVVAARLRQLGYL